MKLEELYKIMEKQPEKKPDTLLDIGIQAIFNFAVIVLGIMLFVAIVKIAVGLV